MSDYLQNNIPGESEKIYTTIGVYSNGDLKINGVEVANFKKHVDYNLKMRPGRAFFVDGVCINKGCLDEEEVSEYTRLFNSDTKYLRTKDSKPYV